MGIVPLWGNMPSPRGRLLRLLALAGTTVVLALPASAAVWASPAVQPASCKGARLVVEGGSPSPFLLPDKAGTTLEVGPDAVLGLSIQDPPVDPHVRWRIKGLPGDLDSGERALGSGPVEVAVRQASRYVRGRYEIEATLLSATREVCRLSFQIRIGGFAGTAAIASTAAAGVAGFGALASAPFTASGTNLKLRLKVQVQRRRPRGWRRWVPIPAWKRTIFGTFIGAVAGFLITVALQQGGLTVLSVATVVRGVIIGGGTAFGAGTAWGALWTYLRPPKEPA